MKITEQRRKELDRLLDAHYEAGGHAYMATFTIPHYQFQTCRELRCTVAAAWRKVKGGAPWQRARAAHAWLGDVRALEVTHGENGWHPHLHVLILFRPGASKDHAYSLGGWLYDRWARVVRDLGYGECSRSAFDFEAVAATCGAAEYVQKWGAAAELTKAHMKRAYGGRSPWQILFDCAPGNEWDRKLFREHAAAFKGARQLTWSRNLRALYLSVPELSDDEVTVAEQPLSVPVVTIQAEVWRQIDAAQLSPEILLAADASGLRDVLRLLDRARVRYIVGKDHDLPYLAPPDFRRRR